MHFLLPNNAYINYPILSFQATSLSLPHLTSQKPESLKTFPFLSKKKKAPPPPANIKKLAKLMRPPPAPAPQASQNLSHLMPPLSTTATSTCNAHTCKWRPYSDSNDFETNATMVLIMLFCALISALALNAAIRCFLRSGSQSSPDNLPQTSQEVEQRKPNLEATAAPLVVASTLVYTAGMKLVGAVAECAICLSEFVEGEGIQVLGRCKHGFHVHCIQEWLSSHSSCPTCRRTCLISSPSLEENAAPCVPVASEGGP